MNTYSYSRTDPESILAYLRFRNRIKEQTLRNFDLILLRLPQGRDLDVLDVGCGYGYTSLWLKSMAEEVGVQFGLWHGVDVSEGQIKAFQQKVGNGYIFTISSWEDFVPTHQHDFVLAYHSWYGIEVNEATLHKFQQAINPGGIGVIALESRDGLFDRLRKKFVSSKFVDSTHIKEILRKGGIEFEIERSDFLFDGLTKGGGLTQKGWEIFSYLLKPYDSSKIESREVANEINSSNSYETTDLIFLKGEGR